MATADLRPVAEPYAGRILTSKNVIIGNLCCFVPLLAMFAGLGLSAGAAFLAFPDDARDGQDRTIEQVLGGVVIAIGLVVTAVSAYWGLRNTTKIGNWYLRRVARSEIRSRPDRIVDPDDPEAIFVELVPRQNWRRLMLETATDVGFLYVDEARKEVLFEGDHEQMRIPAGAILSCEVEHTFVGGEPSGMKYYFTIIEVDDGAADRELPFAYRGDLGQFGAEVRKQRAKTLRNRIWDLMRE